MDNQDSEATLDQRVVDSLKELGGDDEPELFGEIVAIFLGQTPGRLEELERAARDGDMRTIERIAHGLKSSCGNLGARRLAALCDGLERAGRGQDVDAARTLVRRSAEEYRAVSAALRSQLK